MEPDVRVLTVELKVNLLSVASGERLLARGQVIRPGRTLTVCRGDAYAGTGEEERHDSDDPHDDDRTGRSVAFVEPERDEWTVAEAVAARWSEVNAVARRASVAVALVTADQADAWPAWPGLRGAPRPAWAVPRRARRRL